MNYDPIFKKFVGVYEGKHKDNTKVNAYLTPGSDYDKIQIIYKNPKVYDSVPPPINWKFTATILSYTKFTFEKSKVLNQTGQEITISGDGLLKDSLLSFTFIIRNPQDTINSTIDTAKVTMKRIL
jgi:hypothetical protein